MVIRFIGLKKLNDGQQAAINKISNKYYQKIARNLKKDVDVDLQVKIDDTAGKRERFTIKIRIDQPSVLINANSSDWDLNKALHKAFEAVLREIEHKFKSKPLKLRFLTKRKLEEE